jgi:hypothetical protein
MNALRTTVLNALERKPIGGNDDFKEDVAQGAHIQHCRWHKVRPPVLTFQKTHERGKDEGIYGNSKTGVFSTPVLRMPYISSLPWP